MIFYNLDKLGKGDKVVLKDGAGPYLRVPGERNVPRRA